MPPGEEPRDGSVSRLSRSRSAAPAGDGALQGLFAARLLLSAGLRGDSEQLRTAVEEASALLERSLSELARAR